jgi:urease accessory protein
VIELLLLADSRLPSGGHGHSGGVEALVDRGLLESVDDLALFLEGRIRTGGRVVAAVAAAACVLAAGGGTGRLQQGGHTATGLEQGHLAAIPAGPSGAADWPRWEAAVAARTPSTALRAASRAQGAALLRTVALAFPTPAVAALRALPRVHHPLVLGAAAAAAGAGPAEAAALALHHLVGGASTAAVRLLGLDPLRVTAVAAGVARAADPVAADAAALGAAAVAAGDPALLPTEGSPLTDVLAELHRASEATLFAS